MLIVVISVVQRMMPAVPQLAQPFICCRPKSFFTFVRFWMQGSCSNHLVLSVDDFVRSFLMSSSGNLGYSDDGGKSTHP